MGCGECTTCCTLSHVKEINKKPWETCKHCVSNGCGIYGEHPEECKEFECAYLQSGSTNTALRPDNCNVMFFKKSDRIFVGAVVPNKPITDIARGQVEAFKNQGFSVVMLRQFQKPHLEIAKGHSKDDIWREYISLVMNCNV